MAEEDTEDVRLAAAGDMAAFARLHSRHAGRVHVLAPQTVGGTIQFSGPIRRDGTYQFTSHQGAIILDVLGDLDATLSIATVQGGFSSQFPTQMREQRRRGIFTTVAGTGAATMELETFSGGILIRRAGTKKDE